MVIVADREVLTQEGGEPGVGIHEALVENPKLSRLPAHPMA
jgi:hypothetical protein